MAGEAVPLAGLDTPAAGGVDQEDPGVPDPPLEVVSDTSEQSSVNAPPKSNSSTVKETKVIYHIDEEDTPYLVKIVKDANDGSGVRLKDFKHVLPSHLQRYFSMK